MQVTEIWRPVPGYEGLYAVSSLGRVKSLPKLKHTPHGGTFLSKEKILKQSPINSGYLIVTLCHNKKSERKLVHVLVAETWWDNPYNYREVNHDDGDKHNNRWDNLEWCSHSMNMQHAIQTGLIGKRKRLKAA
jgi:hypothetical protein